MVVRRDCPKEYGLSLPERVSYIERLINSHNDDSVKKILLDLELRVVQIEEKIHSLVGSDDTKLVDSLK